MRQKAASVPTGAAFSLVDGLMIAFFRCVGGRFGCAASLCNRNAPQLAKLGETLKISRFTNYLLALF